MIRLVVLFITVWAGIVVALAGAAPPILQQTLQNPPSWVFPNAYLDFDFAHQRYWVNGQNVAIDSLLTVIRNIARTCTNSAGAINYVPINRVCINDLGLLVWGGTSNLILQSQFAASWTATRSTLTANAVTSPDATTDAATLVEDSTAANTHLAVQSVTKAASSLAYTFSVYGKSNATRRIDLQIDDNAGNGAIMSCDLAGQQVGVAAAGVGTPFTGLASGVQTWSNGWTRCYISGTSSTATTIRGVIFLDNGTGTGAVNTSYNGNGTSGATIFGAQLEQNTFIVPSPYEPTTVAANSAESDDVSYTFPLSAQLPTPGYSLYGEGYSQLPTTFPTSTYYLADIDDGSNNNRLSATHIASATTGNCAFAVTGSFILNASGGSFLSGANGKIACSATTGLQLGAVNNTALTGTTSSSMPTSLTKLHIGERPDANPLTLWNGYVNRVAVFLNALSQSALNNITQ